MVLEDEYGRKNVYKFQLYINEDGAVDLVIT